MTQAAALSAKIEAFSDTMKSKLAEVEKIGVPIPISEFQRDISIGVELHQQCADMLDEIKEEIETSSDDSGSSDFLEFSRRFDAMYSRLTPEQAEYFTRKG